MTPWQLRKCVEVSNKKQDADHDHDVWLMWHTEALARSKKIPRMKDFLSKTLREVADKNKVQQIDEAVIIARMKAYNKRLEAESKK